MHSYVGTLDLALGSIQDPFRGNLPQREEWVEIWTESISAISFRRQKVVREMRGVSQICRRRKRQMVAVAAEVARESCRKRLREASSVSVAFDECDTRKIIRARCDTPEPPHQWDGVLGIVGKQYGVHGDVSAELKDDHAVQNLRLLEETLRAFYTPLPPKLSRKKQGLPAAAAPASGGALPAAAPAAARYQPAAERGIESLRGKLVSAMRPNCSNFGRRSTFLLLMADLPSAARCFSPRTDIFRMCSS